MFQCLPNFHHIILSWSIYRIIIITLFDKWKKEGILELQSEKTQVFKLNKKNHLKNIGHLFIPKLNESKHKINFLGFSFDFDTF